MHKWKIINGTVPLLFIASHAFPHIRNDKIKMADVNTGILAEGLAKNLNAYALISTEIQLDPNWYQESEFRNKIKQLIKDKKIVSIFDLHGRRKGWPTLIDTYPNGLFRTKFNHILDNSNIKEFKDNEQLTVSEDVEIPALEIEIRKDGRIPDTETYKRVQSIIMDIAKRILKSRKVDFEAKMG